MKALFAGDISFAWLPPVSIWNLMRSAAGDMIDRISPVAHSNSALPQTLGSIKREAVVSAYTRVMVKSLSPVVSEADLFCANLESVLSLRGEPKKGKKFTLRSDPAYVRLLKRIGITDAAIANNHILDFGIEALEDTCSILEQSGIRYCGLRRGSTTQSPTVVSFPDGDVAIFNYVDPAIIDPDPAIFLSSPVGPYGFYLNRVLADIRPHRDKKAIIVILHWGQEWSRLESEHQRDTARELIDNGAAVVIGHHSHVAGGIEEYRNGLIAYGLGNLFMQLPPFGSSRASRRYMVMTELRDGRLDAYNIIGIGNDANNMPRIDSSLNCGSLLSRNELTEYTSGASVRFDSITNLSKARVSSTNAQSSSEYHWFGDYMVDSEFVRSLFPLGPGWSSENHLASGIRMSRELAGSDFLTVTVLFCSEGNPIEACFDLPSGLSKLIIITGFPDSLHLQPDFRPCLLSLTLGEKRLDLTPLVRRDSKWKVSELSSRELSGNRVVTLSASPCPGGYSVACFRILGI